MVEPANDSFDPYYRWLGIPKKHRPPTHYQLLGVSPDESDHTIIEDAVERQQSHVGHYRGTEFDTAAARVLYELEEAETCLLNPEMRKEYDRQLREKRWKKKKQTTGKVRGAPPSIHGGGKGFEIVPTIFKIVGILLVACMIMAAFSFQLPWQKTGVRTADTPVLTRGSENTEKRPVPVLPKGQIAKRPEEEPALKPQPTDAGDVDQSETITAKVVRVDAGSRSLTVSYNGRTTEFDVSRAAVLLAEGSEVDLDDLTSGLSATITFNPEYDVVTRIEIRSTPPKIKNSVGMQFKLLPGGTFRMGEGGAAHQVILTKPFYLGVYEVTQTQYERVMGTNPSQFKGDDHPVEKVSWEDAVAFCRKLSSLPAEQSAGRVYRLPTEAEWEYACRAGAATQYSFGDNTSELDAYGWFDEISGKSHPVGKKLANPWGLYDMHGNVWEWCQDWYDDYPNGSVTDPIGPAAGSYRVNRGGSYSCYVAGYCRSGFRNPDPAPDDRDPDLGFRVALSPSVARVS